MFLLSSKPKPFYCFCKIYWHSISLYMQQTKHTLSIGVTLLCR